MKQKIDTISFSADFFEKTLYFGIARNVARKERCLLAKGGGQFFDVFLQSLALIIENQTCARGRPRLCNCPGDAALVRNAEHNSDLSFQHGLGHTRSTIRETVAAVYDRRLKYVGARRAPLQNFSLDRRLAL